FSCRPSPSSPLRARITFVTRRGPEFELSSGGFLDKNQTKATPIKHATPAPLAIQSHIRRRRDAVPLGRWGHVPAGWAWWTEPSPGSTPRAVGVRDAPAVAGAGGAPGATRFGAAGAPKLAGSRAAGRPSGPAGFSTAGWF